MAYKLTLTQAERAAFDWIGNRYSNGDEMRRIIEQYPVNPDDTWDSVGPVTFDLPEHAAWDIAFRAEQEDNLFPCFAPDLTRKMYALLDSIV
jgi:hypothetical protein